MRLSPARFPILLASISLIAAACGAGSDDSSDAASGSVTTGPSTTEASAPPDGPTTSAASGSASQEDPEDAGDLALTVADGYTATAIGQGIKPDLELAPDGTPGIAFLAEDIMGTIGYASAGSGWSTETVAEGYFYGPIGLAYTPDGQPQIAYHDHQDTSFQQDKGDLTVASGGDAGWAIEALASEGHDGWDSTIVIGPDGVLRAAGIDPQQFDRTPGVEYYELQDGAWQVTEIGSGPIAYEFNVSLAVDPDGNPALSYFDNNNQDLKYAYRQDGTWTIETVDSDGDVGRYSSLAFDSSGNPHISYLRIDGAADATVRYANNAGSGWSATDVDTLADLETGFTGARRVTAIAVDADQAPRIVYSDRSVVKVATQGGGGWDTSTILTAGELPLGQLVSFRLGSDGTVHLAVFEVTSTNPLSGNIAYITNG